MALSPGTRLGPYEVGSALGAGGMGEVYRARDTKLGRDVAVKALPDNFLAQPERVARFEREAQLLAALNHPNIATIHGLQEANGSQYLVLEFVDGESLAERIGRGPLTVTESMAIARQIVDALESAHEKGIVHRDLKPANIMLTRDDRVKVLDFGLAKALEPDSVHAELSHSPTMTLGATAAGVILGTAAYMAPEQAKGRGADKRSDIWACGCVVYEMLTGTRAFVGEDVSDTLAAVLRAEPDWSALPSDTPANVQTLLKRCLEKDRRARIGDVSTIRYVLDNALSDAAPTPSRRTTGLTSLRIAVAVALFIGAVIAAVVTWFLTWPGPPSNASVRFPIIPPGEQLFPTPSTFRDLALSPDGSFVVYLTGPNPAAGALWMRRLDSLEIVQVRGITNTFSGPFISPDSRWIGIAAESELKRVSVRGGPPETICRIEGQLRGASWGPDGTIVFATEALLDGLFTVPATGGQTKQLTTVDREQGETDHVLPTILPTGTGVVFTISRGGDRNFQIAAVDFESGVRKVLIPGASHAEYVASGHLVYASGGTLQAVRFDPNRLEVLGEPVPVMEGVLTKASGAAQFAVSTNGTLLFVGGTASAIALRSLVWVTRQGREEPISGLPLRPYLVPRLSPDGTKIALDIRDQQNDIWVWDVRNETLTPVTLDPASDIFPVWTRDGQAIIFASDRNNQPLNVYRQAADGTGTAERLTTSANNQTPLSLAPDGERIIIRETLPGQAQANLSLLQLGLRPFGLERATLQAQPLLNGSYREDNGVVSPDGAWLAYNSFEAGPNQSQVYVRPFPDVNSGRTQVSTNGGLRPLWSPNGRELFYIDSAGFLTVVPVELSPSFSRGTPARVLTTRYFLSQVRTYDVSRDGQKFLMIKDAVSDAQARTQSTPMTVVLNWVEELKARVGN